MAKCTQHLTPIRIAVDANPHSMFMNDRQRGRHVYGNACWLYQVVLLALLPILLVIVVLRFFLYFFLSLLVVLQAGSFPISSLALDSRKWSKMWFQVDSSWFKLHPLIHFTSLDPTFCHGAFCLQVHDKLVTKTIQLFETFMVRFGVMLVGPTLGGKTAGHSDWPTVAVNSVNWSRSIHAPT